MLLGAVGGDLGETEKREAFVQCASSNNPGDADETDLRGEKTEKEIRGEKIWDSTRHGLEAPLARQEEIRRHER